MARRRSRLTDTGDHAVEPTVWCVATRMSFRHPLHLFLTWRQYRRVARDAERVPGLLRSQWLFESPTTCWTLSLWTDREAIARFGTEVPGHVSAVRSCFGRLRMVGGVPELWSTKWRLAMVSNNLAWSAIDLRAHLRVADHSTESA